MATGSAHEQIESKAKGTDLEATTWAAETRPTAALKYFEVFHTAHFPHQWRHSTPRQAWRVVKCLRYTERAMVAALSLVPYDPTTIADLTLAGVIADQIATFCVCGRNMFDGDERALLVAMEETAEATLEPEHNANRPLCGWSA